MKTLNLTLPTPHQNLACDEALLDWCEAGYDDEILRFWESPDPFVVLGYSNKSRAEANLDACAKDAVPVLRRCSGGGAVLQGPGCLNFTLILKIPDSGPLAGVTETNQFIMSKHRDALSSLVSRPSSVVVQGHSDLTLGDVKFSGNAQRRKRRHLLFHGSFLLNLDLDMIERTLPLPSREPTYRHHRPHKDFLLNIGIASRAIRETLAKSWQATAPLADIPFDQIATLARDRYVADEWTFKF